MTFIPSNYQKEIFRFLEHEPNNLLVDAKAGSGKTTTAIKGLNYIKPELDSAFLAFNKSIATELGRKAPAHVSCSTIHSLSFYNLRQAVGGKIKVDNWKAHEIIDIFIPPPDKYAPAEDKEEHRILKTQLVKLTGLIKNTLTDWNSLEEVYSMIDEYALDIDPEIERYLPNELPKIMDRMMDVTDIIDFNDMIWLPIILNMNHKKFDFLAVDEAQDLNSLQIEFTLRSINGTGRILAIGDPKQSIYHWRGADSNAIQRIISATSAEQLPLSITYRCPTKVVELAQRFVPDFEARDNAPEGIVEDINPYQIANQAQEGDLILCRVNAPLISTAFSMIKQGKKAVVKGRDIGKNLARKAKKASNQSSNMTELISNLYSMKDREIEKVLLNPKRRSNKARINRIEDQYDTLFAIVDNIDVPDHLPYHCEKLFSDDRVGIMLSSVHRAKGLEADNVFILRPDLMPHPRASGEIAIEQENNIQYVAITRAKNALYFAQD